MANDVDVVIDGDNNIVADDNDDESCDEAGADGDDDEANVSAFILINSNSLISYIKKSTCISNSK